MNRKSIGLLALLGASMAVFILGINEAINAMQEVIHILADQKTVSPENQEAILAGMINGRRALIGSWLVAFSLTGGAWAISNLHFTTLDTEIAIRKALIKDTQTELSKFAGVFIEHNTRSRTKPLSILIDDLEDVLRQEAPITRMLGVFGKALSSLKDECRNQRIIIIALRWNLFKDIDRLEQLGVQAKSVEKRLSHLADKDVAQTLKDDLYERVRILWDRLFELAVAGYFAPEDIEDMHSAGVWTYVHDDSLRHYLKPNGRFHDLLGNKELALWHKYLIEAKNPRPKKDQAEDKA